jgi:CubicO group peptidase (beta-lactamase class C family)
MKTCEGHGGRPCLSFRGRLCYAGERPAAAVKRKDGQVSQGEMMQGFPPPAGGQVTLANWRQPPFNRWAFQNVRQIVPTAGVWRGVGPAASMARAARPIEHIAFQGADGREWTVGRMLAETATDGLLVLRDGSCVVERYDHGLRPETPHIIFSVSKSVTGTLAGIVVGDGRLDPDAPVTRYIPEAAGSAYGDCTVRHVLDMTVSTDFVEDYLAPSGAFARYRVATGWNPAAGEPADLRGFLATLGRGPEPHGTMFHYVSPNSDLLGWILERATGTPYATLLSEELWQPMGASDDAYVTVDRLGAPRSAGGLCVTLRDLARVGELRRRRGAVAGRQLVPDSWIDDILTNGDAAAWRRGRPAGSLMPDGRYRSQWYSVGDDHGAFCAIGIHGQWIYVDPATAVVIAKLSSLPLPLDEAEEGLQLAGLAAIARGLG